MKKEEKQKIHLLTKMSTVLTFFCIRCSQVFASGFGTAEVETATENIKRVITSIAMTLGRSFNFYKYSNCSDKNDCKC